MSRKRPSFKRAEGGSAAVEFALVAVPFVGMLFAALQIFLIFFAQQVLETAAEDGSRMILTGKAQTGNWTQATFKAAVCAKMSSLLQCNNVMIDVQTATAFSNANTGAPTVTYDNQGNVSNQWAYTPGTGGQIVVMRVLYLWPVFNLPGLTLANQGTSARLMMATAVFKTEIY